MRPPVVAHLLEPPDDPRRRHRTVASATVGRENKEVSVNRWHGSGDAATKRWEAEQGQVVARSLVHCQVPQLSTR